MSLSCRRRSTVKGNPTSESTLRLSLPWLTRGQGRLLSLLHLSVDFVGLMGRPCRRNSVVVAKGRERERESKRERVREREKEKVKDIGQSQRSIISFLSEGHEQHTLTLSLLQSKDSLSLSLSLSLCLSVSLLLLPLKSKHGHNDPSLSLSHSHSLSLSPPPPSLSLLTPEIEGWTQCSFRTRLPSLDQPQQEPQRRWRRETW